MKRFARFGFKFNFAAIPIADNAIADDESKASAGAHGFGGENSSNKYACTFAGMPEALVQAFGNSSIGNFQHPA